MQDLNRREFVTVAATAVACACLLGGACEVEAADAPAKGPVDAGALSDYGTDKITDTYAKTNKFFIVRNAGKLYATTSICTHKSAALKVSGNILTCPKHGSKFSVEGTVDKGPAKVSLVRYAISTDDKGHVIVDTSKQFTEKEWDNAASFIEVKK